MGQQTLRTHCDLSKVFIITFSFHAVHTLVLLLRDLSNALESLGSEAIRIVVWLSGLAGTATHTTDSSIVVHFLNGESGVQRAAQQQHPREYILQSILNPFQCLSIHPVTAYQALAREGGLEPIPDRQGSAWDGTPAVCCVPQCFVSHLSSRFTLRCLGYQKHRAYTAGLHA